MSTKIYQGFLVKTDSAAEILALVDGFRPYIHRQGQKLFKDFVKLCGLDEIKSWMNWMDIRRETVEKGIRAPHVDTQFQLVFFPDGKRFLGIAFTEHERWFRQWLRQPLVQEYGYWDNTDKPKNVSQLDWDTRGCDWDRVAGCDPVGCSDLAL
jgi:hypothetical protein